MKGLVLICLLFLFRFSLDAQDSILTVPELSLLSKKIKPEAFTDSVYSLAKKYKDIDAVKSIYLFNIVIDSSKSQGNDHLLIRSYNMIGLLKGEQNLLPEAYQYHQDAFKVASRINDSTEIAASYNQIGDVYKRLRLQEKGVEYVKRAIAISELKHDSLNMAVFSDHIGHIFMDWAEESGNFKYYQEALKNYRFAYDINAARRDTHRLSISHVNLANGYMVMFRHGADRSFLRTSLAYSLKGRQLASKSGDELEWVINTINLGEANYYLEDYKEAIHYYDQCFPVFEKLNKPLWCAAVLVDKAKVFKMQSRYEAAIDLVQEANRITKNYDQVEPYSNYELLAELYFSKKEYEQAYKALKKYELLYHHDLNSKAMLELEGKQLELDIERRDKKIELLNEENKYNVVQHKKDIIVNYALFGLTVLLLALIGLMLNRSRLLKKSKDVAERARIMQQQFLANTSHEIRTPMNGILGMVQQLEHSGLNNDQKQSVDLIKKSANGLLAVINDVLDLSKIQAGKLVIKNTPFQLHALIYELRDLFAIEASAKDLRFETSIATDVPMVVCGDKERVRQVLLNLLSNAIKFTEQGSVEIDVQCGTKKNETENILFSIKDTGIGIASEKQAEIFESFVQIESATQRAHGGTGLGLTICKSLVGLLGGIISLKSKQDEGSVFEVLLPFERADNILPESSNDIMNDPDNRNLSNIEVLIVEDNLVNQQVIAKILERWNCQYVICSTAVEGFEKLSEGLFDIILMDIEMPGINGWEATEYIRSKFQEPARSVPILALTAYAYDSEKEKCIKAGMNDVLTKPYSEGELYTKIRELVYNESVVQLTVGKSNMDELEARYCDDKEGLRELYELFISEIPLYVEELKYLRIDADSDAISRLAHKMKSPVSLIGKPTTIVNLRRLNAEKNLRGEQLENLIKEVISDCYELVEKVRTKLSKL